MINDQKTTATAHLIFGFIGAGKTTFARKLEAQTGAMRITKDEWLIRLFGHDPAIDGFEKYDEAITGLSFDIALQALAAGADVIIDDGFWVRTQRDEIRRRIAGIGARAKLYYVQCSEETMRKRIRLRNENLTEDTFLVDDALYESYLKYFDEPGDDEDYIVVDSN